MIAILNNKSDQAAKLTQRRMLTVDIVASTGEKSGEKSLKSNFD
jgi:hypothetical protein